MAAHAIPPGGRPAAGAAYNPQMAGWLSGFCFPPADYGCGHRIIFPSFTLQGTQKAGASAQ
ncbi:MAG: hypothetical protein LBU32_10920 [Clostridiales bacterium]|jgi:hypothetical protein|nr:hypothetical protein [Clostridiales bacterium]